MDIQIREFSKSNLAEITDIWNGVVEAGNAFPQLDTLSADNGSALEFFSSQSFCAEAVDTQSGAVLGLYILHPNNVGRCGHIANASFAVSSKARGNGVGESLVRHCLKKANQLGFKVLQFNAVVKSNTAAHKLYQKLGFTELGTVPGGFLSKSGEYEDIVLYYHEL